MIIIQIIFNVITAYITAGVTRNTGARHAKNALTAACLGLTAVLIMAFWLSTNAEMKDFYIWFSLIFALLMAICKKMESNPKAQTA